MNRRSLFRPALAALLAALAAAACGEVKDGLHDVGKIRATFYRHELKVAGAPLAMPGDRLVPDGGCGGGSAEAGLFDPCRPDGEGIELDAWGMPKPAPGPWAARSAAPPPPVVQVPGRKPTPPRAAAMSAPAKMVALPPRKAKPPLRHVPRAR
ncbi:hypothetical protein [Stella sp.]|uniref:hypothetical protein n=1 Tax=Stella sp. TaxID=2912054 RepID=UPI0035AD7892